MVQPTREVYLPRRWEGGWFSPLGRLHCRKEGEGGGNRTGRGPRGKGDTGIPSLMLTTMVRNSVRKTTSAVVSCRARQRRRRRHRTRDKESLRDQETEGPWGKGGAETGDRGAKTGGTGAEVGIRGTDHWRPGQREIETGERVGGKRERVMRLDSEKKSLDLKNEPIKHHCNHNR